MHVFRIVYKILGPLVSFILLLKNYDLVFYYFCTKRFKYKRIYKGRVGDKLKIYIPYQKHEIISAMYILHSKILKD